MEIGKGFWWLEKGKHHIHLPEKDPSKGLTSSVMGQIQSEAISQDNLGNWKQLACMYQG